MQMWANQFCELPEDVGRIILETAARASRQDAVMVSSLSKVIRSWTIPILFHSCFIPSHIPTTILKRHGKHVRHLSVQMWSIEDLQCLLHTPNVCNLAISGTVGFGQPPEGESILGYISHLPLRQLHLDISTATIVGPAGLGLTPLDSCFQSPPQIRSLPTFWSALTMLELPANISSWTSPWSDFLTGIPHLTHLVVRHGCSRNVVLSILQECLVLRILVIRTIYDAIAFEGGRPVKVFVPYTADEEHEVAEGGYVSVLNEPHWSGDIRVISVECSSNYLKNWNMGTHGGQGMWEAAAGIVMKRKVELARRNACAQSG